MFAAVLLNTLSTLSANHLLTSPSTVSPPLFQRTLAPTALSDMLSSIFLPQVKLSVPLMNSQARRSLSARSLFSLLASQKLLVRRPRVAEVRLDQVVRVVVAALVLVVVEAVAVVATHVVLVEPVV